jgi:hypothetical protein
LVVRKQGQACVGSGGPLPAFASIWCCGTGRGATPTATYSQQCPGRQTAASTARPPEPARPMPPPPPPPPPPHPPRPCWPCPRRFAPADWGVVLGGNHRTSSRVCLTAGPPSRGATAGVVPGGSRRLTTGATVRCAAETPERQTFIANDSRPQWRNSRMIHGLAICLDHAPVAARRAER